MVRVLCVALAGVFLCALSGCAKDPVNILIGTWTVDLEASIDHAMEAGEFPESERDTWTERLGKRVSRQQLVIERDLITIDQLAFSYQLLHSKSGELRLRATILLEELSEDRRAMFEQLPPERQTFILTYVPQKDHRALFLSSATNDMDHLVWKKGR